MSFPASAMSSARGVAAGACDSSCDVEQPTGKPQCRICRHVGPVLGAAPIWVSNIGAHGGAVEAGGVEFLLNVEWPTPLNVMVTITVLDEIDQFVIV
jgi:hypothetical protein